MFYLYIIYDISILVIFSQFFYHESYFTMFKKIMLITSIFSIVISQANMCVHGTLNMTKNSILKSYDFSTIISEHDYKEPIMLIDTPEYNLSVKITTTNNGALLEFSIKNIIDDILYDRALLCKWDKKAYVNTCEQKNKKIIEAQAIECIITHI